MVGGGAQRFLKSALTFPARRATLTPTGMAHDCINRKARKAIRIVYGKPKMSMTCAMPGELQKLKADFALTPEVLRWEIAKRLAIAPCIVLYGFGLCSVKTTSKCSRSETRFVRRSI
jgi:hypothetical protein